MKRILRCSLLASLLLAGCSSEPPWDGTGIVTNRLYDDPDDWTTHDGPCVRFAVNAKALTCAEHGTVHHHDAPHWYVQVTSLDGTEHTPEVDQSTHDRCRLGAQWAQGRCVG